MSLNKVMLIGNVGKNPDIRYLEGNQYSAGNAVKTASFTLATNERYKDSNGIVRENTEWHNIVAWRAVADFAEKYISTGSQIYVEGRIRTRSWNDREGNTHYKTEIQADSIQLLGRRSDSPVNDGQFSQPAQPTAIAAPGQSATNLMASQSVQNQTIAAAKSEEAPSDDLPF